MWGPRRPPPSPTPFVDGFSIRPESGDSGPTPNYDTVPPRPGGDPLKEPSRPIRQKQKPDRLTVGAVAASHVELADKRAAGRPIDHFIDAGGLAARLAERVVLAGLDGEADLEYNQYLNASLASMEPHSQIAACLMADHDDIATEL